MTWKPIDVQQLLNLVDMEGGLEELHEVTNTPDDMWVTPPPVPKQG